MSGFVTRHCDKVPTNRNVDVVRTANWQVATAHPHIGPQPALVVLLSEERKWKQRVLSRGHIEDPSHHAKSQQDLPGRGIVCGLGMDLMNAWVKE